MAENIYKKMSNVKQIDALLLILKYIRDNTTYLNLWNVQLFLYLSNGCNICSELNLEILYSYDIIKNKNIYQFLDRNKKDIDKLSNFFPYELKVTSYINNLNCEELENIKLEKNTQFIKTNILYFTLINHLLEDRTLKNLFFADKIPKNVEKFSNKNKIFKSLYELYYDCFHHKSFDLLCSRIMQIKDKDTIIFDKYIDKTFSDKKLTYYTNGYDIYLLELVTGFLFATNIYFFMTNIGEENNHHGICNNDSKIKILELCSVFMKIKNPFFRISLFNEVKNLIKFTRYDSKFNYAITQESVEFINLLIDLLNNCSNTLNKSALKKYCLSKYLSEIQDIDPLKKYFSIDGINERLMNYDNLDFIMSYPKISTIIDELNFTNRDLILREVGKIISEHINSIVNNNYCYDEIDYIYSPFQDEQNEYFKDLYPNIDKKVINVNAIKNDYGENTIDNNIFNYIIYTLFISYKESIISSK